MDNLNYHELNIINLDTFELVDKADYDFKTQVS